MKINTEKDLEKLIIESMKWHHKCQIELDKRTELLLYLNNLLLITGQSGRMFCNAFLRESVQLIVNSIFLYEYGNFECAFYSLRQAFENSNNMLYLANNPSDLKRWIDKKQFERIGKIKILLTQVDTFYSQIKHANIDFFSNYDELTAKVNKIVHKQGFDTFYWERVLSKFDHDNETSFFIDYLTRTIAIIILLYIALDPLTLVLSDDELSYRLNFNPMTEQVDFSFFEEYFSLDIIENVKLTPYFKEFSSQFLKKEKMFTSVFNIIRNDYFDVSKLNEIESQKHLLASSDIIKLELLKKGLEISAFICYGGLSYNWTSIKSNLKKVDFCSSDYDPYFQSLDRFNQKYYEVFLSKTKILDEEILIEHNDRLNEDEINTIISIEKS